MIPNGLMGYDPRNPLVDPATFAQSMARTFQFEGGLNKRDTNGTPSNFGVNQKANPDVDVTQLTQPQAADLYKKRYWDAIGADKLSGPMAHVAFDTAVIAGPGRAQQFLDISNNDPSKFMDLRKNYLDSLVQKDPEKYAKYDKAWAIRNATLREDAVNWDKTGGPSAGAPLAPLPAPIDVATLPVKSLMDPENVAGPKDTTTAIGDVPVKSKEEVAKKEKDQLAGLELMAKGLKGDQSAMPSVLGRSGSMLSDDQNSRMQAAQALMAGLLRPRGLMG